ncbi:hypothetical protein D0X99_16685 [Algoriphagus lacus]|uniref:Uncharacterized protein n=1 Tax=Algoriphagus lacus TaxID=2056311 RepID=A0A418PNU1_9BACT|nr:hypothetical protein D0X99_16685 [Algoriphagus lacus]
MKELFWDASDVLFLPRFYPFRHIGIYYPSKSFPRGLMCSILITIAEVFDRGSTYQEKVVGLLARLDSAELLILS